MGFDVMLEGLHCFLANFGIWFDTTLQGFRLLLFGKCILMNSLEWGSWRKGPT